jgi:hypothetical protein
MQISLADNDLNLPQIDDLSSTFTEENTRETRGMANQKSRLIPERRSAPILDDQTTIRIDRVVCVLQCNWTLLVIERLCNNLLDEQDIAGFVIATTIQHRNLLMKKAAPLAKNRPNQGA